MPEKAWKRSERKIARLLGGQRVPVTGRARGHAPDVEHGRFAVEVKSRQRLPCWLLEALEQAEAARSPGQIPIAILHERGRRYSQALVVLRLEELLNLIKTLGQR